MYTGSVSVTQSQSHSLRHTVSVTQSPPVASLLHRVLPLSVSTWPRVYLLGRLYCVAACIAWPLVLLGRFPACPQTCLCLSMTFFFVFLLCLAYLACMTLNPKLNPSPYTLNPKPLHCPCPLSLYYTVPVSA